MAVVLGNDSENALESGAMKVFPRSRCRQLFTRGESTGKSRSVKNVVTVGALSKVTARCAASGTDGYALKRSRSGYSRRDTTGVFAGRNAWSAWTSMRGARGAGFVFKTRKVLESGVNL
jgi:hypothetical protein